MENGGFPLRLPFLPKLGRWTRKASCKGLDPNIFFPVRGNLEGVKSAVAICGLCPVKKQCLEYAITHPILTREGIWGGTTPKERENVKRRRRVGAA